MVGTAPAKRAELAAGSCGREGEESADKGVPHVSGTAEQSRRARVGSDQGAPHGSDRPRGRRGGLRRAMKQMGRNGDQGPVRVLIFFHFIFYFLFSISKLNLNSNLNSNFYGSSLQLIFVILGILILNIFIYIYIIYIFVLYPFSFLIS